MKQSPLLVALSALFFACGQVDMMAVDVGSSLDGSAGVDAGPSADVGPGDDAGPGDDSGPGLDVGPGSDAGPGSDSGPGTDAGPVEVALNLDSSFETARGTTDEALMDGARWDGFAGNVPRDLLEVVGAENGVSPIDGDNMLRIGIDGEQSGGIFVADGIDLEADDNYIRFYAYTACIDQDVGLTHYVEDFDGQLGLADSRNFWWRTNNYNAATGRYKMGWASYADQSMCSGDYFGDVRSWGRRGAESPNIESNDDPNGLECGEWYRIEINISCINAGCMNQGRDVDVPTNYRMRVYDEAGTQILGNEQFRSWDLNGEWQGGGPGVPVGEDDCYVFTSGRPSFHIGNNGQQGVTANARAWMYFDRVATSSEGWIGE